MDDGSSVPLVKVLREGHKVVVLSLNLGHCKGGGGGVGVVWRGVGVWKVKVTFLKEQILTVSSII